MASSSSANKPAKLAKKGKGKKVRFQGGTLFPAVIVGILVLLLPLIIYARQSRPSAGEGPPTIADHWHAAFAMYVCDENGLLELPVIDGALEELNANGTLVSRRFGLTGIHSHEDGVIHWHAYSGASTGTNAKLSVFLRNYDIEVTNSKLVLPAAQGGQTFEEGKTKCVIDGKEQTASLKAWVWDNYSQVGVSDPSVYTADIGGIRIRQDGMVIVIAFVPDDVEPYAPDYVSRLPELGAADGQGSVTPNTTSTGETVTPESDVTGTPSSDAPSSTTADSTATSSADSTATSTASSGATATTGG